MEPGGVEAQDDRRQGLQDDHAADELEVDGELGVEAEDHQHRTHLDEQGGDLADLGLLLRRGVPVQVLLVDVAGEQVGGGDRHDRSGDESADGDRGEGDPREPVREHLVVEQRDDGVAVAGDPRLRVGADGCDTGGDRHVAEQCQQAEHDAVRRQGSHVALDDVAAAAGEDPGDRVRVDEQRQRRAERQRRVAEHLRVGQEEPVRRPLRRRRSAVELLVGRPEDRLPAAELAGDVDDGRDDHDVDQGVLDEGNERRCAKPGLVGVDREDEEGDDQRQVADDALSLDAHRLQDRLDAHQLQRDVGHGRDDAGQGDHEGQRAGAVTSPDEVGRGDVAVPVADRPEPDRDQEDHRVHDDRVRHGEEAQGPGAVDQGGDRDEGVRRVEVTADEEPGDP